MFVITIGAVFFYPKGLDIFISDANFNQSIWIFGILMIGVTLNSFYRPFLGILLQGDRPGYHTLMVGILVVFNFIGNIILIPFLGIYGAAIATACVYSFEGLLIKYYSKRLLGIHL
jgi:O-antigen/teichoic acid export membrane protein